MLLGRFGQQNKFWKKSKSKYMDIQQMTHYRSQDVTWRSAAGRPENVLRNFWINLPETSSDQEVPKTLFQEVPPTSPGPPLKTLLDHPRGVLLWCSGDVLKWCPGNVLIWHPRYVSGSVIQKVPREPSKHVLGTIWGHLLDAHQFLFTFLSELIRLTKSI